MTIWLAGGLLVVFAALIGFFLGAIRSAVSLVGLVLSAALAKTVGGWVAGLVPSLGFPNPVWQFYLPPLLGFLIVGFVFLIVALVAHQLIESRLRNRSDEYSYARWFRLNRHTGAAIGAVIGTVWLVILGMLAYVPGYLSTQLADAEEDSISLRTINRLTHDAEQTGLSRLIEHFQPAQPDHYAAADVLGLVYNNPAIQSRLASYPPFLGLAEKPEIAELAKDPEVNTMIQSRAGLAQILEHAKIRAVVDNHELVNQLLALDLADLDSYLRTGVSGKYKDEHILGRWRLNVRRSIAEMKLSGPDKLPTMEFNLLRKALNVYLAEMTIGFTTDNKAILKVKATDEQKLLQTVGRSGAAAPAGGGTGGGEGGGGGGVAAGVAGLAVGDELAGGSSGPGLSARSIASRALPRAQPGTDSTADLYRNRYGVTPGSQNRGGAAQPLAATTPVMVPRAAAKPQNTTALGPLLSAGEGSWSKDGDSYKMTFAREGKDVTLEVAVKENQLTARMGGRALVFDRI